MYNNDPRGFAKGINDMVNNKRSTSVQAIRMANGNVSFDPTEVLRTFRDGYAALGKDEIPANATYDMNCRQQSVDEVEALRHMPSPANELNSEITQKEIAKAITKQKDGACSPLDQITNLMLSSGRGLIIVTLKILFNAILKSGFAPTQWQTGIMSMIYKADDKLDWKNYRGITLLSIVGKLLESVLAARIANHLEAHGKIPAEQGGFRKQYSCADHEFVLSETVKYRARRSQCTYAAFLDIRKAYPTMHRATMLSSLAKVGIDGNVWKLIDRMYSGTVSQVQIDGRLSDKYEVNVGLREGSVISPILYSVYINTLIQDLATNTPHCGVCIGQGVNQLRVRALLYADDVVLLAESAADLQAMLKVAENHANRNQYQFSVPILDASGQVCGKGKSAAVVFGAENITGDTFYLHNVQIDQVQSYKYLGIWMHQSLGRFRNPSDPSQKKPWEAHIEYTKQKIESRKFLLRKMKCQQGGFSPRMAKNLLQSHACSVATYGAEIWNTAANGSDKIEQVFALMRQAVLGTQNSTPDAMQRAELGVLSQQNERDLCSLRFLHRILTMKRTRLVPQVFKCLMADTRKGTIDGCANWATLTIPRILGKHALDGNFARVPSSKKKWTKMVRQAVQETEQTSLRQMDSDATKFAHYNRLRNSTGMPRYLSNRRGSFFNLGRSIKTKLRCDTHELAIDSGRRQDPPIPAMHRYCECCDMQEIENAFHFVFDCPLNAVRRLEMTDMIDRLTANNDYFGWRRMSWNQKLSFLLGDGPEPSDDHAENLQWTRMEICFYHYLAHAYQVRRTHLA